MNPSQFPIVAVGGVLIKDGRVLLIKRGHEPAKGLWAIPGGKIKFGERIATALKREFKEETNLLVTPAEVVYVFDAIDEVHSIHYVIIDYLVEMEGGEIKAGDDAVDIRWFDYDELNDPMIAPATRHLLKKKEFYSKFMKRQDK